ncbi:SWI5-dependent HO expression protein 4 [Elasticomyces elasticus]|nr:SWI5-dependent HO expression protein 4 [Elasticomyces elasticus]
MVSLVDQDRANTLIAACVQLIDKGDLQGAAKALKEASALAPENEGVKNTWYLLQQAEQKSPLLIQLKKYLEQKSQQDGEDALRYVRHHQVQANEAENAMNLLLESPGLETLDDKLTGALLQRPAAQSLLASRVSVAPTVIFEQLWQRGEESFSGLLAVVLDGSAWRRQDDRSSAQRDVFQLAIGKMMDAGLEHPERAMQAIARLLAVTAKTLQDLINQDVFDVVLSALDVREPPALRSQALLAISKLLEITQERGERMLTDFVTTKVHERKCQDLIIAFSAAGAVFPIIPSVAATLFLTEGFIQTLVPMLHSNTVAIGQRKSHKLELAALELLNAACIDKSCREAIRKYCIGWLREVSRDRSSGSVSSIGTLILAKISQSTAESSNTDDDLVANMTRLILVSEDVDDKQRAVEGLAYSSLNPKVKEEVVSNVSVLKKLVNLLKDQPVRGPLVYGCLTIFSNLTVYRPTLSDEEKKMSHLKAYADASKPRTEDPLDDDSHVTARCKTVLDLGVLPIFVKHSKGVSAAIHLLIVRIFFSISKEQKHRGPMAQQGTIGLLLQLANGSIAIPNQAADRVEVSRVASHALARILISTNPAHVFSSSVPASSATRPLLSLLTPDLSSQQRDLLPTFEALLALTNLASIEDNTLRDAIVRLSWDHVEDFLLSSNVMIQRASVELVCNLMASPSCVAKFGDGTPQAAKRMQILLALADVEDIATRRAAGGALAMLTEWDAAVRAVLDKDRGVKVLLEMCEDDGMELRHRGLACLLNVAAAPGDVGKRAIEKIKDEGGIERLKMVLRRTSDPQMLGLGVEVLKLLA